MKSGFGQLSLYLFICIFVLCSCFTNKEENPVIPPETSPLTRNYIGFGVITASFTHISLDPIENSDSIGYLRRGSLVKIIRRQLHRTSGGFVSWVLIDGNQEAGNDETQQGWLKEDVMDIYENESQAKTASESMAK